MWNLDTVTPSHFETTIAGSYSNSYSAVGSDGGVSTASTSGVFENGQGSGNTHQTVKSGHASYAYSESKSTSYDDNGSTTYFSFSETSTRETTTSTDSTAYTNTYVTAGVATADPSNVAIVNTTTTSLRSDLVISRSTTQQVDTTIADMSSCVVYTGTDYASTSTRCTTALPATTTVTTSSYHAETTRKITGADTNTDTVSTTQIVSTDLSTVTVGIGSAVSNPDFERKILSAILFSPEEWPWLFTFTNSTQTAVLDLTDVAVPVSVSEFVLPEETSTYSAADASGGIYPYTLTDLVLAYGSFPYTITRFGLVSRTLTGLDSLRHHGSTGPNALSISIVDILPLPRAETYPTTRVESTGVSTGQSVIGTDFSSGLTAQHYEGVTTTEHVLSVLNNTVQAPTVIYDILSRATNTSTTSVESTYMASTDWIVPGNAPVSTTTSYDHSRIYVDTDGKSHEIPEYSDYGTSEGRNSTTSTQYKPPIALLQSNIAKASFFEPTFDTGLRVGSRGKCNLIGGVSDTWYYPFFSQVLLNLWVPMTYSEDQVATYYHSTYNPDFSSWLPTGTVEYLSYHWSRTATDFSVSISRTWDDTDASSTSSTSTHFVLSTGNDDATTQMSAVYYEPLVDQLALAGGTAYADLPSGLLVVGGAQWNGQPATAWLGRGIWQATSYDTTGGSTSAQFKLNSVSTLTIDTTMVVAFKPKIYWEVFGSVDNTPQFAITTFNKWQY